MNWSQFTQNRIIFITVLMQSEHFGIFHFRIIRFIGCSYISLFQASFSENLPKNIVVCVEQQH